MTIILSALGTLLVAATLPLMVELAVLTAAGLAPRRKRRDLHSAGGFDLTVVVPAHNEEAHIARTVESLRHASADVRILVVAHNCSDSTAARARQAGAEVVVLDDETRRGKGFALIRGFECAFDERDRNSGAGGVLVIDADSTVSPNLIGRIRLALEEGAEAVQCRYEMAGGAPDSKQALAALALRAFNFVRPRGRERLGLSAGILGNGFAMRRSVFTRVPYSAHSLVEDLEYHLQLVLHGVRVRFLENATVYSELPAREPAAASQRARWEGGRMRMAMEWLGPLARHVARGRWRAIEPLLDLAGLPIGYAAALLAVGVFLPLPWLRIYAAASFAVILLHVVAAARAGGDCKRELRLLALSPIYVLWKLRVLPRTFRGSRAGAEWVRTERAEEKPLKRQSTGRAAHTLEDAL